MSPSPAAQTPPLLRGLDVSRFQGRPDWPAVAESGLALVYHRLTGGDGYVDPEGLGGLAACRRAGLRAGPYHFLTGAQVEAQVEHFLRVLSLDVEALPARLPPMLDLERADAGAGPDAGRRALAWLRAVEEATGQRPILYTGPSYAVEHHLGAVPELAAYPLWIAHYGVAAPTVPAPWRAWTAWQHSGSGRCPGVVGAVDLSTWHGMPGEI